MLNLTMFTPRGTCSTTGTFTWISGPTARNFSTAGRPASALGNSRLLQISIVQVPELFREIDQDLLGAVIVYKLVLPFDSLEKIQHVVHEIVRVAVSDKPTIAIPADDAIELGVEIFKY